MPTAIIPRVIKNRLMQFLAKRNFGMGLKKNSLSALSVYAAEGNCAIFIWANSAEVVHFCAEVSGIGIPWLNRVVPRLVRSVVVPRLPLDVPRLVRGVQGGSSIRC